MMSFTFGLLTQVSGSGPLGPFVLKFADENFDVCFSVVKDLKKRVLIILFQFCN